MKIEIEKNKFYIDEKLNTLFVEDIGTDIVGARIANDKGSCKYGNKKSICKKIYKQFLYQEIEVNKTSNVSCLSPTFRISFVLFKDSSKSLTLLGNDKEKVKLKQNIIKEINNKHKILMNRIIYPLDLKF